MLSLSEKIREERKRLGFTQVQFAEVAGVQPTTQVNYEKGTRVPDAAYLVNIAEAGADVLYILTGNRAPTLDGISNDELEIVRLYRAAPIAVKAAAYGALTSSELPSGASTINVSGTGQRIAGRDFHENKK